MTKDKAMVWFKSDRKLTFGYATQGLCGVCLKVYSKGHVCVRRIEVVITADKRIISYQLPAKPVL